MKILALLLTVTAMAVAGCTTRHTLHGSSSEAPVTDLGTIALNDHDSYECALSGARICRVRLTALPEDHVVVEVVVLSQDGAGRPERILARPRTVTDLGKTVTLDIGEGSVSLTPQIKAGPASARLSRDVISEP